MTQINLLPWREDERKFKRIRFFSILGGFIGLTIFVLLLFHLYVYSLISAQQKNNELLNAELAKEQLALAQLNKKKQSLADINNQLKYIFSFRDASYRAVRLLNELVKVVPDAVLLKSITREGNTITLVGKANTNLQVTLFMENIRKNKIFKQPVLTEISGKDILNSEKIFKLKVEQQE